MKIYDKLIAAEIYRDGGSLEARFRFADGGFESLWLSVLPWDTPAQIAYGDLRVAFDSEGAEHGRLIPIGSEEEREVLTRLREFLRAPKVDIPFSHNTDPASFVEKAQLMMDRIPRRKHRSED